MKFKKLLKLGSALVLALSTLLSLSVPLAHAATYTCNWTGNGGDNKFSTPTNWSNCNGTLVPVAGDNDNLVFDKSTATPGTLINDLPAGTTFTSITFQGSGSGGFTLSGNAITLVDGSGAIADNSTTPGSSDSIDLAITLNASHAINVPNAGVTLNIGGTTSDISGNNNLTKTGAGTLALLGANALWTGSLTANGGTVKADAANAFGSGPGAVFSDGADFAVSGCSNFTFNGDMTLNGNSSIITGDFPNPKLGSSVGCSGTSGSSNENYGSRNEENSTVTLTGHITLNSDITFAGVTGTTNITGIITGAHSISMLPGYTGKLVITSSSNGSTTSNGTQTSPLFTKILSDNSSNTVEIFGNNQITIDGSRGSTTVHKGGTLMGTGTVGSLTVDSGGTAAPGHSPGCLNSGNLALHGIYQAQIGGTAACTGHDQIKVTGSVDLSGSTITPSLYNGFVPSGGQSYVVIANDGADAVTGTFSGVAEGGSITNNGVTYSVSYKGGDGNDVVLTVTKIDPSLLPGKPNTGFELIALHPLVTLAITVISATTLLLISRRFKAAK